MERRSRRWASLLVVSGAGALAWGIVWRLQQERGSAGVAAVTAYAPVEVAPIEHGPIALLRTFSGALEPTAEFVVAPKVAGRVERLAVDLADPVERGQVVAWLDDAEHQQAVAQAAADLEVARAGEVEAVSELETAERELQRIESLSERGVTSESQLDSAAAARAARAARLEVARAQVTRAEAALETARIRLGYTQVTAGWSGGSDVRVVSRRYVDEGETVTANTPLLAIVELDPIAAVVFVPERDYARLRDGQAAVLTTQAYPGEEFGGTIARIAPVFRETTRQARVELEVGNADQRLKPGMFVRATVELANVTDATIVPDSALAERGDRTGVFVVDEAGPSVVWRPVSVGIREGERVQIEGEGLVGRVVTLGHQLVDDGARVVIPGPPEAGGAGASAPAPAPR